VGRGDAVKLGLTGEAMARVGPALGVSHAERVPAVAPIAWLVRQLEAEQERWFLWLPVMFGGGIALYFLLPVEPWTVAAVLPVVAALAVHLTVARGAIAALMTGALLATALGVAAAKLRTEAVGALVLTRQVGPVDVYGFIELVEPRASKGQRLTIRVTALEKHEAHEWPYRMR
jgi:competence protein ComEC